MALVNPADRECSPERPARCKRKRDIQIERNCALNAFVRAAQDNPVDREMRISGRVAELLADAVIQLQHLRRLAHSKALERRRASRGRK